MKTSPVNFSLPERVLEIISKMSSAGHEIYIVGGAVRDLIAGRDVDDWDFATSAAPEEILKVFPDGFYDNSFGTVGVVYEDSPNPYEITTYRKESGYSDSRRPDSVVWGESLEEDLTRRDFTINAMALGGSEDKLVLVDNFGGRGDLKKKLVKCVGYPNERFSEDALRLMRAVRIATELGFKIEDKTLSAINANATLINKIAGERVRDELLKILSAHSPHLGIMLLRECGLLSQILPELEKTFGVEQKSPGRHHIYDVGTHSVNSLKEVAEKTADPIVRLATLLHDIGKPQTFKRLSSGTITFYNHEMVGARMVKSIASRLKLSKKDSDKLWRLVRYHQFTVNENQTDAALRRFIRRVTPEYVSDMLALRVGDRLGGGARETSWRLEEFKKRLVEVQKQPFSIKDIKINGEDVMKILDIPPGPDVGKVLANLFEEVVENKVENTRDALIAKLKNIADS